MRHCIGGDCTLRVHQGYMHGCTMANRTVLKTVDGLAHPWVRTPPPPPYDIKDLRHRAVSSFLMPNHPCREGGPWERQSPDWQRPWERQSPDWQQPWERQSPDWQPRSHSGEWRSQGGGEPGRAPGVLGPPHPQRAPFPHDPPSMARPRGHWRAALVSQGRERPHSQGLAQRVVYCGE